MEERRPPPAPNTAPAGLEPRGAGGTRSPGAGTGAGSAWAVGAWHLLPLHPRRDILGSGSDGLPRGPSSTPPGMLTTAEEQQPALSAAILL